MSDKDRQRKLRGIKVQKEAKRAGNQELWINAPLQNTIRDALSAREWSISDLGRAIGSQPSLISRWMMGARPSTESLIAVSQALGLDIKRLLILAGHMPPDEDEVDDDRVLMLMNKLKEVQMTDERFAMLNGLLETMRKTEVREDPATQTTHAPGHHPRKTA